MKIILLGFLLLASCSSQTENLYEEIMKHDKIYLVDTFAAFEPPVVPLRIGWVLSSKPGDRTGDGEWIIIFEENSLSIEEYSGNRNEKMEINNLKELIKKISVSNTSKLEQFKGLDEILEELNIK